MEDIKLSDNEIMAMLENALNPPKKPKAYEDAYEKLKAYIPFNYNSEEDMKDCLTGFLDIWFRGYMSTEDPDDTIKVLSTECDSSYTDIMLNSKLMESLYGLYCCAYCSGAAQQKGIDREKVEKVFRCGILLGGKDD